jgi:hypothetical protein
MSVHWKTTVCCEEEHVRAEPDHFLETARGTHKKAGGGVDPHEHHDRDDEPLVERRVGDAEQHGADGQLDNTDGDEVDGLADEVQLEPGRQVR